jgi:hypothetical protein
VTEHEWLACAEAEKMLEFLRGAGRADHRTLRLFSCACCRRIWELLDREGRQAVEVAERFADGLASEGELRAVWHAASTASTPWDPVTGSARSAAYFTALPALARGYPGLSPPNPPAETVANHAARGAVAYSNLWGKTCEAVRVTDLQAEETAQAGLLRDVFSPFHPLPAIDPTVLQWNSGLIPRLARAAYEERLLPSGTLDSTRLAVLADALEEAGSDNEPLLAHCRGAGPHVRGCVALDAILGKS